MKRIALIAAFPGELRPLVRGWKRDVAGGAIRWRRRTGPTELVAACAGVGAQAAERAFLAAEREGPVDEAISVGWAGSLRPELAVGRAFRTAGAIDAASGARFAATTQASAASPMRSFWVVTTSAVADAAEKRRLGAQPDVGLVDMEAAAVGRLARDRGIPFGCVKAVTDGPADRLPKVQRFIAPGGKFRSMAFLVFVLLRPPHWLALIRLGANSRKAAIAARDVILPLLE